MRKFTLALLFVLTGAASFAQCPAVSDFSESFDASDEMPECWSTLRVNPPVSPYAVVQVQTDAANSFSPPNSVRMFNQLGGTADFYLISPKVSNLPDGDHQLRFVYRGQPNNDGLDAIIEVGTMTDPADESTFTLVQTLSGTTDAFQEFTVPFADSSTDQYVAIKADFQVTFRNIFFDDVTWEAMPTCPKPTDLEALNITANSADLSWTAGGSETEWEVVYGEAGFNPETEGTTVMDNDELGISVSDLSIGTDYEFYVKAVCGADDQSIWSFAGAFTTLCDIYPLNYAQDFATFVPNCWSQADAGNPTTGPSSPGSANWMPANFVNNPDNGPAFKIILYSSTVSDWLISPQIDLSAQAVLTYDVGFTVLNGTVAPEAMGDDDQVQVLITTDGGTTWETLMTYNNDNIPSGEGMTETIDLSAYSGTVQFAFWATDGTVANTPESYDVFFDNFAVNEVTCPAVSDFSESFDASDEMPECWSTLRVNPPASPYAVVQVQTDAANSFSPPNSVRMFNQLGGSADFYLISPKVSNLPDGDHQLRFVYRGQPNTEGLDAKIEVGTMTDPADESTFTLVQTLSGTTDAFQEFTVPFADSSTDQYVAIKADFQVTFRNIFFDDVTWEAMPTCPKPTDLEALNITASSADLSWTAGGSETEWEVVYGEAGFNPETEGTNVMDNDELGISVSDLSIGTDYEFYVKAVCGADDQSIWSFAGAFTTLCDIYPLNYAQDFATFVPNCWSQADAGNPTTGPSSPGSANWMPANFVNNPDNGPAFKIILYSSTVSDWLISPQIDLSAQAVLTYDVGFTVLNGTVAPEAMGDDDQVQVLITTDGGTTWETLMTYNNDNIPSGEGMTETIDLSAYSGTVQFAFWATDGTVANTPESYDVFFDNFAVNAVEIPCVVPTDLAVENVTENSALVTWSEAGNATEWEVLYDVENFDPSAEGISTTVNDTPELALADLSPETAYDVYVRALCGGMDNSDWTGPVTFTTQTSGIENIEIAGFNFYPNPVADQMTITANTAINTISIYTAVGRLAYQSSVGKTDAKIDLSALSSGVYVMRVTSNDKSQVVKFVKE